MAEKKKGFLGQVFDAVENKIGDVIVSATATNIGRKIADELDIASDAIIETAETPVDAFSETFINPQREKSPEESLLKPEEIVFNEQCVLVEGLKDKFYKYAQQRQYKNFTIADGDPAEVNHYLTTRTGIKELLEIRPEEVSLLLPLIKITKVIYPDNGPPTEQPFFFSDHLNNKTIENILFDKVSRGDDVGIKSFSYELSGKNIAVDGLTKCTLKLFFRNVNAFIKDTLPGTASFKDLIIRRDPKNKIVQTKDVNDKISSKYRISNSEYFRIKIQTGWSNPDDPESVIISPLLRKAIDRSKIVLFLELSRHNIDFNQDGTFELTLEYIGAMEGSLRNPKSDLFFLDKKKNTGKEIVSVDLLNQRDSRQSEQLALVVEDDITKYSKLMRMLLDNAALFYIDIPKEYIIGTQDKNLSVGQEEAIRKSVIRKKHLLKAEVHSLSKQTLSDLQSKSNIAISSVSGPTLSNDSKILKINDIEKRKENANSVILNNFISPPTKLDSDKRRVNFFFLGDLIDIVFGYVKNRKDTFNLNFLIGSMIYVDPRSPTEKNPTYISIADIPISIDLFISWFLKNVVAPRRTSYYAHSLIKDIIETLVIPALGEDCFTVATSKNEQLQQINIMNYSVFAGDFFNENKKRINSSHLINKNKSDIFSSETHHNISKINDILFFYVTSKNMMLKNLSSNPREKENIKNGIYHLYPSSDRGLVKSIKFSKSDIPYEDEMRISQDSSDVQKLRYRYNAKVTMIGNSLFKPGMYVYIDTNKFGFGSAFASEDVLNDNRELSVAQELGIGGYYQIIKVSANVGKDDYEVELDCRWIYSGGGSVKKTKTKSYSENVEKKFYRK